MIKIIELFGGIGALSTAFELEGIPFEIVDYVEIDKYAVKSFNAMHGTNFKPQDIREWDKDIKTDFIMHGSPCQDFSLAGKQKGGDEGSGTRSSLLYETLRIVAKLNPKYVLWENVANILSDKHKHNFDTYLKRMEETYENYWKVLNAKDYGIPQNRARVFTLSILGGGYFRFPPKKKLTTCLKDYLEKNVDKKFFLSAKMITFFIANDLKQKKLGNGFRFSPTDGSGISKTITTSSGNRMDDNFILIKTNTKLGYEEAKDGDSINLSYPNSSTRRGRVGHGVAQTLEANNVNQGVLLKTNVLRADGLYLNQSLDHFRGTMPNLSRTLKADGSSGGVAIITNIDLSDKKRFEIYKIMNDGIIIYTDNNIGAGVIWNPKEPNIAFYIRSYTPLECWRLQGFPDEYFYKAKASGISDTQLKKQAGNSISVPVLRAIIRQIFKDVDFSGQLSIFDLEHLEEK